MPARTGSADTSPAAGFAASAEPHAAVRLVAARETVRPGETVELGLSFAIEPGWHLYWQGRNDSGLYPMVAWEPPGGVTVGDMRWPAPERKISPGRLLDHVYHDRVTLLVPVSVPADAAPGDELVLRGDVSWVVCREACIAEQDSVELRLRVAAGGDPANPEAAALLDEARSRLPEPLAAAEPAVLLERTGDRLALQAPAGTEVSFFPALDCVDLADPVRDAHAEGDRLDLEWEGPGADARLRGVLEVRYDDPRSRRHFALDLPIPAPAG